ncbi:MAG: copper-translocating P-type ATPase [Pusillimonas sp.]|nr:copper-translocating P-type ATPase [Pusillimonas sp.]
MDCAAEESDIRRALEPIEGIRGLNFQLSARLLVIDAPDDVLPQALTAISKAGFNPKEVSSEDNHELSGGQQAGHRFSSGIVRLILALAFAVVAESLSFFAPETQVWQISGMMIALIGIGLAGFDTYTKGFLALRQAKLNINALMSVAVTGAFLIGQWAEAAMVMALYALAELIEARAVDRARNAIKGLLNLAPETAEVLQEQGNWSVIPAKDVAIGQIVRLSPGQRVALDGVVTAGSSTINQASVTGESIPVDKTVGDQVYAGTINESGSLEFEVTAIASESTLSRIIHAVEQAQSSRAPTQRFVDKFAAIYTPTVFIIALIVAMGGPLVLDWTWLESVYKALVLLVIACPCALVISTPVTVVSGLAAAARRGILIKGGTYLEEARKLKAVAFDKTGTITQGKPKLVTWELLSPTMTKEVAAGIAVSLAGRSDHPVSKAIANGLSVTSIEVNDFAAIPGLGVAGVVAGIDYVLGNHRLMAERSLSGPELEDRLGFYEREGRTVTLLATNDAVLALFVVADTIKPSSQSAMLSLKQLGVSPVMLTGDNQATAQSIGRQAGIDDVRGGMLPQEKLDAIQEMQAQYGLAGMAGDGINDAPALAQADIGFAMGAAGTDIAMEAADVVIMNDDLHQIASSVKLSRKTHRVLWQNILFALGIKAVFLFLAIFYGATMWMAVFADMGASLLVVANGLRLLRF